MFFLGFLVFDIFCGSKNKSIFQTNYQCWGGKTKHLYLNAPLFPIFSSFIIFKYKNAFNCDTLEVHFSLYALDKVLATIVTSTYSLDECYYLQRKWVCGKAVKRCITFSWMHVLYFDGMWHVIIPRILLRGPFVIQCLQHTLIDNSNKALYHILYILSVCF